MAEVYEFTGLAKDAGIKAKFVGLDDVQLDEACTFTGAVSSQILGRVQKLLDVLARTWSRSARARWRRRTSRRRCGTVTGLLVVSGKARGMLRTLEESNILEPFEDMTLPESAPFIGTLRQSARILAAPSTPGWVEACKSALARRVATLRDEREAAEGRRERFLEEAHVSTHVHVV